MGKLTHVNSDGKVVMVDVGDKPPTQRLASGSVEVHLNQGGLQRITKVFLLVKHFFFEVPAPYYSLSNFKDNIYKPRV